MLGAVGGAGRKPRKIVEGLMVRLEIRAAVLARVDDAALFFRRTAAVRQRLVPAAGILGPTDVLLR